MAVVVALIAGIFAAGSGAAYVLSGRPVFESNAVMIIDQPGQIPIAGNEGILSKLNRLRSKYTFLAKTRRLIEPVAKRVNLPVATVGRAVSVFGPGPSLVLVVTARTSSKKNSQAIANEMATELINFLKAEMDAAKVPEEKRIVFTIVSPAQPGGKIQPTRSRASTVGLVSGGVAALAVLMILQLLRLKRQLR